MQFHSILRATPQLVTAGGGGTIARAHALEGGGDSGEGGEPPPPPPPKKIEEVVQNLLKHIPGEASGFYLMAADAFTKPTQNDLFYLFLMAIALLILVRWLAGASLGIIVTSAVAFGIWMFCFDKGYGRVAYPDLLPQPWGLIVAGFYSSVVTLLASSGKIR